VAKDAVIVTMDERRKSYAKKENVEK